MLRSVYQKHRAIAAIQEITYFSFLLATLDCDPGQFTPGGSQIGYGTKETPWLSRHTNRSAQFHHGLVEITGAVWVKESLCELPPLGASQISTHDASENAFHIAVHNRDRLAE